MKQSNINPVRSAAYNRVKIAIQKDGRLKKDSLAFFQSLGLRFSPKAGRMLIAPCQNHNAEILYVRHGDIPQYIQSGAADFGIVGENILFENDFDVKIVKKLEFGQCALVIAAPMRSRIQSITELEGERIATSYPNSLRKFLQEQRINASIVEIKGSVELAPALGLADAICDLTQTGNSLKENRLKQIAELFKSEAVLIESVFESEQKREFIKQFLYD